MPSSIGLTVQVETNTALTLIEANLDWGIWDSNPVTDIFPGSGFQTAFIAGQKPNADTGITGFANYRAEDGTLFNMCFNDSFTGENECTITSEGEFSGLYSCSVDFPKEGLNITAKYSIKRIAEKAERTKK